jgi:hypothetical protein
VKLYLPGPPTTEIHRSWPGYYCDECPEGKYNHLPGRDGSSACIECPAGKYNHLTGAVDCIDCPAGQYIAVTGSDELADCIDCMAGQYIGVTGSDDSTDCIGCPGGQYVGVTGSGDLSDCIGCPAGKYVELTGSINGKPLILPAPSYPSHNFITCSSLYGWWTLTKLSHYAADGTCLDTYSWTFNWWNKVVYCSLGTFFWPPHPCAWTDPQWTCADFVSRGYCAGGSSQGNQVNHRLIGDLRTMAERHCCACGKIGKEGGRLGDDWRMNVGSDPSASFCIDCSAGTYIAVTGSGHLADCIGCPAGKYVGMTGSEDVSACKDCAVGRCVCFCC